MSKKQRFVLALSAVLTVMMLWLLIAPDILEARRGGGRSFGGSRGSRSFGGSKSFGGSRRSTSPPAQRRSPSSSFGTRKAPTNIGTGTLRSRTGSSFSGTRMASPTAYTSKYGAPRKVIPAGTDRRFPSNYVVNSYGGYGSGLMTGYLLGSTSWMWAMPFHPAFYYSKPYYVQNPNGTVGVYPPTFSFTKLLFTLIIFAAIAYLVYVIIRNARRRRSGYYSRSSFG